MKFSEALPNGLIHSANILVTKMKQKVKDQNIPVIISNAMSIGNPDVDENGGNITITIDTKTAPMAAAYEWGSGLHNTKQMPGLYPIKAKNVPNLVFWWERGNKWFVGSELPHGHPGVEARPYIEPSITEVLPEIKQIIGDEARATIILGIKEMFKT